MIIVTFSMIQRKMNVCATLNNVSIMVAIYSIPNSYYISLLIDHIDYVNVVYMIYGLL